MFRGRAVVIRLSKTMRSCSSVVASRPRHQNCCPAANVYAVGLLAEWWTRGHSFLPSAMELISELLVSNQLALYIPVALVLVGALLVFTFGFRSAEQPPFDKISLITAADDRKSATKKRKLKDRVSCTSPANVPILSIWFQVFSPFCRFSSCSRPKLAGAYLVNWLSLVPGLLCPRKQCRISNATTNKSSVIAWPLFKAGLFDWLSTFWYTPKRHGLSLIFWVLPPSFVETLNTFAKNRLQSCEGRADILDRCFNNNNYQLIKLAVTSVETNNYL